MHSERSSRFPADQSYGVVPAHVLAQGAKGCQDKSQTIHYRIADELLFDSIMLAITCVENISMTTTAVKTPVEAKWNTAKIQEEAARVMASNFLAIHQVLGKLGEQAVTEFETVARKYKVDHLKSLGVKTPIELVKALGEFDTNVYGSKVEVTGNETSASITYNACGMWNAVQKVGKLTPEQEERMGKGFESCMQNLAKEMGMKASLNFQGESCTTTFTKA
jgi:hypothetical protein